MPAACLQKHVGWPSGAVAGGGGVAYLLAMTAAQKAQELQEGLESTPPAASAHEKILIVDFGSQVTQLIARRVREDGV